MDGFYTAQPDDALRFGDVVKGFLLSATDMEKPHPNGPPNRYNIKVLFPDLAVILTPCCSIGDKKLALAPLDKVNPRFFENPFFEEDLTRINREMDPDKTVSPQVWQRMAEEEKKRRLSERKGYALIHYFIYAPASCLPQYRPSTKDHREIAHYMVDFRKVHHIQCPQVNSAKDSPFQTKVLQLSRDTREDLRLKLSSYFSRVPDEDQV